MEGCQWRDEDGARGGDGVGLPGEGAQTEGEGLGGRDGVSFAGARVCVTIG